MQFYPFEKRNSASVEFPIAPSPELRNHTLKKRTLWNAKHVSCADCMWVIARKGGETREGQGARLRDLNKICCELWTGPFPPGRVGVQHRKVHFICEGFFTRRLLKWFTVGLRHSHGPYQLPCNTDWRIPLQTDRISTLEERIPLQKIRISTLEERIPFQQIRISTLQSFFHLESCIPFGQDSSLSLYMVFYISTRSTFNI